MKRQTQPPLITPPSISLQEGKRRLEAMRDKGKELISSGRVSDERHQTWVSSTVDIIKQTFGSRTPHKHTFVGECEIRVVSGGYGRDTHNFEFQNAKAVQKSIAVLDGLIDQIQIQIGFDESSMDAPKPLDFWSQLHPEVVKHAKTRYETGHYADSVEAALKALNETVKDLVKTKIGKELDGASLMRTAFSPNNPVITFDTLATENGKNIQNGYMDIFAGSMTGIRNPKAHSNIQIDAKRAMHHLFLASLLFYVLHEGR